jgi:DNA repair exonuclease SbcCD ATPase subunit
LYLSIEEILKRLNEGQLNELIKKLNEGHENKLQTLLEFLSNNQPGDQKVVGDLNIQEHPELHEVVQQISENLIITKQLAEFKEEVEKSTREMNERLNEILNKVSSENTELREQIESLKNKLNDMTNSESYNKFISGQTDLPNQMNFINIFNQNIEQVNNVFQQYNQQYNQYNQQTEDSGLRAENEELRREIEKEKTDYNKELANLKSQLEAAQTQAETDYNKQLSELETDFRGGEDEYLYNIVNNQIGGYDHYELRQYISNVFVPMYSIKFLRFKYYDKFKNSEKKYLNDYIANILLSLVFKGLNLEELFGSHMIDTIITFVLHYMCKNNNILLPPYFMMNLLTK